MNQPTKTQPIRGEKKTDEPLPHRNLLGSIDAYKELFMKSNINITSTRIPSPTKKMPPNLQGLISGLAPLSFRLMLGNEIHAYAAEKTAAADARVAELEAGLAVHKALLQQAQPVPPATSAKPSQEPMFWVRVRSDGGYEGPIHNDSIEDVHKTSSAWTPLYAVSPTAQPALTDTERLNWLDQNIFSRELTDWDGRLDPDRNMWVMFAPKGYQGSARNIIDAALIQQTKG